MNLISDKGMKVDLHIHSKYSKHKDGNKVDNNTVENINTLKEKLIENEVNICAITDHDTFNYDIYRKLKEVEIEENCIKKVLPGIEFSVQFQSGEISKVIHIVTLFNDNDQEKVKTIEEIMKFHNDKPQYDYKDSAFTEDTYLSILRKINLDTIMIAHQKNSLTSEGKPGKNDANSLGEEKFNEFLFTEYFEAFEFRNKKNEIFNKKYIFRNGVEDDIRFITGSDCHDWSVYPSEEKGNKNDFSFTYMKCLPTFKGVVMAMTDQRRIKLVNSFFNPNATYLDKIQLEIDGKLINIPMSRGINVIIGDNSIGKSMLVHKLTDYVKSGDELKSTTRKGYDRYLSENRIKVITKVPENYIFRFDSQGYVRKLFEENKINRGEFLHSYFPEDVDVKVYRMKVENELERLYDILKQKFTYDNLLKNLSTFEIKEDNQSAWNITFLETLKYSVKRKREVNALINDIREVNETLVRLFNHDKILEPGDLATIRDFKSNLDKMEEKYKKVLTEIEFDKKKINIINSFIRRFKEEYSKQITDEQKTFSDFIENKNSAIHDIFNLVFERIKIEEFKPKIKKCIIEPNINNVFQYKFVSKIKINDICNEYITELINSVLKKGQTINTSTITVNELKEFIQYYPNGSSDPLDVLKQKINEKLDQDFSITRSIIFDGMDRFKDLSTGLDSQIYFTLLSYETKNKNIYIIDQPEDDISQRAIRDYLLDRFKTMGEYRQVIMITHNPQFIVNLDVDNVIYLSKENEKFNVKSGALEYENSNYSILKVIADNIDGGLDTIERRLKRYEKGICI